MKIEDRYQDRGPISQKVLSGIKKAHGRKVVDLSLFKEAKLHAENLDKSVITTERMAELDPLHAVYVYAQNKISIFVEQLSGLPELSKLTDALAAAQDETASATPTRLRWLSLVIMGTGSEMREMMDCWLETRLWEQEL